MTDLAVPHQFRLVGHAPPADRITGVGDEQSSEWVMTTDPHRIGPADRDRRYRAKIAHLCSVCGVLQGNLESRPLTAMNSN